MPTTRTDYQDLQRRKAPWLRPLRRAAQVGLARACLALARLMPMPALQALGRGLGLLGMVVAPGERRVADYQLALALPQIPAAQRRRLIRRCFQHLGMTAVEFLAMPRIRRKGEEWLRLEGAEHLVAAHARGQGVVLVTAHVGNWELLSAAHDRLRIPMLAVARPLTSPALNRIILELRRSPYSEIVERGTPAASRKLLAGLKSGRVLIVLIDQDIEAQSVWVKFFGMPAKTPRVAASLALRLGTAVVTGFDERLPDGRHCIHFQEVPVPEVLRQDPDGERLLTQALSDRIEAHVRAHPEQWAWNHRRWLHAPEQPATAPDSSVV